MMKQMGGMPGMPPMPGMGRKAKRQQTKGGKKKGPGRAGGGPSRQPALPAGLQLPPGLGDDLPAGLSSAFGLEDDGPDPFGLRRPR
jgi:hypothetical protein